LLLKPREAAKRLGISERTLWTITKAKQIPSVRIGRSVRYSIEGLRAWVSARENASLAHCGV
jgi:excisionase family DNA binding protein